MVKSIKITGGNQCQGALTALTMTKQEHVKKGHDLRGAV